MSEANTNLVSMPSLVSNNARAQGHCSDALFEGGMGVDVEGDANARLVPWPLGPMAPSPWEAVRTNGWLVMVQITVVRAIWRM